MKAAETLYRIMLTVLVLALASLAVPVYAQNPAPPGESDESWCPPEESGEPLMQPGAESKSSSTYYLPPQPGTLPYIQGAYFVDQSGQRRMQLGDEPFYLVVQANTAGYFYAAEYFAAESGRLPQWLVYRHYLDHSGTWTLGPYYAEPSEPAGKHTWKLWLYSSGKWARGTASFNYQPYYPPSPVPPVSGSDGWGPVQVLIVAILAGSLGITIGMLLVNKHRYGS